MTTVVDTNVIVALWDKDDALNSAAQSALDRALARGYLVVPAPVFAELKACPTRSEEFLESFFRDTGIGVDRELEEPIWRTAGRAFRSYAGRPRKRDRPEPRRIVADFLIGAYAFEKGYELLTLDDPLYRTAFPTLRMAAV